MEDTFTALPAAAESLSGYIISRYENAVVKKLIARIFDDADEAAQCAIFDMAKRALSSDTVMGGIYYERRRKIIEKKLLECFCESGEFSPEAFIRFRLDDWKDELVRTVCDCGEKYYISREYDEFVALLRYFVSVQKPRRAIAHIRWDGGCPIVFDSDGRILTRRADADALGMTGEDASLSALVEYAPHCVVLHEPPDDNFTRTVFAVFDRVRVKETAAAPQMNNE